MWGGQRRERRVQPLFGTITALSGDSITITPEVPDFVADELQQRGMQVPTDLPSSVTLSIVERTRFAKDGAQVESDPFSVGDKVAIIGWRGRGGEGEPLAAIISDYASAQQKLAELKEKWGERQGIGRDDKNKAYGRGAGRGRRQHQQ